MPDRPVLYLLPGLLCDATVWARQSRALASMYEVVVPSFRGLDSIAAMARSVLRKAPSRFSLAGHSMGARVALEISRTAGHRLDRLALFNTGLHPARPGESAARQALVDLAHTSGMRALAACWLPPMVAPNRATDRALMAPLEAMVERHTPADFERQVRALLHRPDARESLSLINCPTTVAVGRLDGWSPIPQHEAIVAQIADAELEIIEDSGHMSPVEQPQAVLDVLERWLERPERIFEPHPFSSRCTAAGEY